MKFQNAVPATEALQKLAELGRIEPSDDTLLSIVVESGHKSGLVIVETRLPTQAQLDFLGRP